jgi:hypothetical protein
MTPKLKELKLNLGKVVKHHISSWILVKLKLLSLLLFALMAQNAIKMSNIIGWLVIVYKVFILKLFVHTPIFKY